MAIARTMAFYIIELSNALKRESSNGTSGGDERAGGETTGGTGESWSRAGGHRGTGAGGGARGGGRWRTGGHASWGGAHWLWLHDGSICGTGGVGGKGAVAVNADGLGLSLGLGDHDRWWGAAVVEGGVEGLADDGNVGSGDTERGGGEADLLDEVRNLVVVKSHVLVDAVHAVGASVRWETAGANHAAAKEVTEVRVQVGEKLVLGG